MKITRVNKKLSRTGSLILFNDEIYMLCENLHNKKYKLVNMSTGIVFDTEFDTINGLLNFYFNGKTYEVIESDDAEIFC